MYDLFYEFIRDNLFNSQYLSTYTFNWFGVSTPINQILSHFVAVALIVLCVVVLLLFIKWLFRLVSGIFLLR